MGWSAEGPVLKHGVVGGFLPLKDEVPSFQDFQGLQLQDIQETLVFGECLTIHQVQVVPLASV